MGKGRERNGTNEKRVRKGREADGWGRQPRNREGGTGTKVRHYGSLYDSRLSLVDTETQMEAYFEPSEKVLTEYPNKIHMLLQMRNFIFSCGVSFFFLISMRENHTFVKLADFFTSCHVDCHLFTKPAPRMQV